MTRLSKSRQSANMRPTEEPAQPQDQTTTTYPSKVAELDNPAMLAQRLGSESSWAEDYVPSTHSTTVMTPSASSVTSDFETLSVEEYPRGPPPAYELSAEAATVQGSVRQHGSDNKLQTAGEEDDENNDTIRMNWEDEIRLQRMRRDAFRKRLFVSILLLGVFIFCGIKLMTSQGTQQPIFNHPQPFKPSATISATPSTPVPTRDFSRHETSQSITGTFTLHDSLDLSTTSGSINIIVDLRPGSQPAVLKLSSESGSINVYLIDRLHKLVKGKCEKRDKSGEAATAELINILGRSFHTDVRTSSGSVRFHNYVHGNGGYTKVETKSGSINLWLQMIGSGRNDNVSHLLTTSSSGSHHVQLTPSMCDSDASLGALRASHHSTGSASMHLNYPKTWEGMVHGSVRSGSVRVSGKGLEYQHAGSNEVFAWRGKDANENITIEAKSDGSGSIGFSC